MFIIKLFIILIQISHIIDIKHKQVIRDTSGEICTIDNVWGARNPFQIDSLKIYFAHE